MIYWHLFWVCRQRAMVVQTAPRRIPGKTAGRVYNIIYKLFGRVALGVVRRNTLGNVVAIRGKIIDGFPPGGRDTLRDAGRPWRGKPRDDNFSNSIVGVIATKFRRRSSGGPHPTLCVFTAATRTVCSLEDACPSTKLSHGSRKCFGNVNSPSERSISSAVAHTVFIFFFLFFPRPCGVARAFQRRRRRRR